MYLTATEKEAKAMANFKEVNKVVGQSFPLLDVEVVRGVGYVYYSGTDAERLELASIMTHPTTTSTVDILRMVMEDIEHALK